MDQNSEAVNISGAAGPDRLPVTEEEMVSVRISLSQLEGGDYSEVRAGSDDIELQRMLDSWKE